MDGLKMSLCPSCIHCPEVAIEGDEVRIGEAGNLAVLKKDEWNVLVDLIQSGQLSKAGRLGGSAGRTPRRATGRPALSRRVTIGKERLRMGGLHEASNGSRTDRGGRHHGGCRRRSAERAAARHAAPRPPDAHAGWYVPHDERDDG